MAATHFQSADGWASRAEGVDWLPGWTTLTRRHWSDEHRPAAVAVGCRRNPDGTWLPQVVRRSGPEAARTADASDGIELPCGRGEEWPRGLRAVAAPHGGAATRTGRVRVRPGGVRRRAAAHPGRVHAPGVGR